MQPYFSDELLTLYHGDNRDVLTYLPANSVDSCVTDPPYELGFMGRKWDASGIAYDKWLWAEVWRVLKPGGHLLAFGGTRTWHRLACAIEDAGFEVRDSIAWMYGSGFPKSLDVSKAIDKAARGARVVELLSALVSDGASLSDIGDKCGIPSLESSYRDWLSGGHLPEERSWDRLMNGLGLSEELGLKIIARHTVKLGGGNSYTFREGEERPYEVKTTAPSTDAAKKWQGWGTALKPAFEPVVVARKPLIGTVAENVLTHGTGALNIDACRIGTEGGTQRDGKASEPNDAGWENMRGHGIAEINAGRWPANVMLDESQAAELDRQSGVSTAGAAGKKGSSGFVNGYDGEYEVPYGDTGGASRFFYTAKANSSERPRVDGVAHPTVKPLDLMRYLVRLVTPPGGTVLEPFAGSGTTAEACIVEGFKCIAIEMTDEYLPLIAQRVTKPIEQVMF